MNPVPFSGFSKVKKLYITGHSDGAINFWDASCPIFIPILSLKQQVNFISPWMLLFTSITILEKRDKVAISHMHILALAFDGGPYFIISFLSFSPMSLTLPFVLLYCAEQRWFFFKWYTNNSIVFWWQFTASYFRLLERDGKISYSLDSINTWSRRPKSKIP